MAQLRANGFGQIQAIVGPMFSGKSEELIRRLVREMFANKKVLVVRHCRDTRTTPGNIATHDGSNALQVNLLTDTMAEVYETAVGEDYDVVGIDEGQFFPQLAHHAEALAGHGKLVIVAALDANFLNHPTETHFASVMELLPKADTITKLRAICSSLHCGQPTPFYMKRDPDIGDGARDLIGGFEKYRPVCRPCYAHSPLGPEFNIPTALLNRRNSDIISEGQEQEEAAAADTPPMEHPPLARIDLQLFSVPSSAHGPDITLERQAQGTAVDGIAPIEDLPLVRVGSRPSPVSK